MEFRVLGPLEVAGEAAPVPVGGPRERALLARLLLSVNQVVSSDALAEDLWAGAPPEGAGQALWVYVSRLRKALRAQGDEEVVITRPPGYLLRVEPEAVDSCRFEALVEQARRVAANGDPAAAAATLREALALWRGPALADVADAPFAKAEAARLEEARLAALEERIDADLACGRHGLLVGELAGLTREHPLRERLWAQRMLALYRAGRQAEALRAYQDVRRYLGEELGIEPREELRRLETAMLRHERGLDWPTSEQANRPAPNPSTLPLPLPLERESSTFVARAEELRRLEAAWEDARAGRRQLVLLAGEPGIGKTCLAAEFAKRTHPGGAAVLFGRCDEGMGVPYQPFVEALDVYLRQAPTPALGRLAGELVRLVPEIPERVGDLPAPIHSDPETERYRLFDAVAAWLSAVSAESPAVLVIDDLHWASRPTLSLLGHLLRSGEPLHLLVVATYRDTDVTAELTDALADLMRQPGIERIRLSGLDQAGVAAYMEARARHQLDDAGRALAATVHARTAGNPFFVGQVVRHLAETEAIVRREGRWTPEAPVSTLGIPEGVRDVIAQRLARLPAETGDLLALASVLGDRFELNVLVRASGDPEVSTLRALDPAIAARLITESGDAAVEYRFVHALVRATLYDGLPRSRRVEFHRRAATAIEAAHGARLDDDLPALAHHYARAGSDERPSAIDYATRAGHRALAQRAHDEAVSWYRQALDLLATDGVTDEAAQHCDLLIALGDAQRRAGDAAHRQTLLDAGRLAQQLGEPDALARAALANYRGLFSFAGSVDADRVALLEAALDTTGRQEDPLRARLLANLAVELVFVGDSSRRRALSDEALTIARRSCDPATLAQVLLARCVGIWEPSNARERLANTEELLSVAERLTDPAIAIWAWIWRALAATCLADLAESDRSLDHVTKLATDLRQPMVLWVASYMRTGRLLLAGRLREAEHAVMEARELGVRAGQPDANLIFGVQRYQLRFEQGRLNELAERLRQACDERDQPVTRAYVALAYCELDRVDDARRVFAPLEAQVSELPVGIGWLEVASLSAAVCASLGDQTLAARLHDLLEPFSDQLVGQGVLWWGSVSHYLGLLAATLERHDEAEARFAAAQRIHEQLAAPTWLARTRLEWARMLLTRRQLIDDERARDLLREALDAARSLGLGSVERQAVGLLQQ